MKRFELENMEFQPKKVSLQDIIKYQTELLETITLTIPKISNNIYAITSISDKFTNRWVTLYSIKTGESIQVKCSIKLLREIGCDKVGSVIKVSKMAEEFRVKKIGDDWIQTNQLQTVIKTVIKYEI